MTKDATHTAYLMLELSPIKQIDYKWASFYKRSILLCNTVNHRQIIFHHRSLSAKSQTELAIETYNQLNMILNAAEADLLDNGDIESDENLVQFVYDNKTNSFYRLERYWL